MTFFAVFGVLATIYYGIKSRQKKKISYAVESECLITNYKSNYGNIKVLHGDLEVENLTVTKIYLWNSGNTYINSTDIAPKQPIEVLFDDINILEYKIISLSDDSNNIRIYHDRQKIKIDFDYLDKKDGVIIQILHDGIDNKKICLKGKIKGGCSITKVSTIAFKDSSYGKIDNKILVKTIEFGYIFVFLVSLYMLMMSFIYETHNVKLQKEMGNTILQLRATYIFLMLSVLAIYFKFISCKIPKKINNIKYVDFITNQSVKES